MSYALHMQHAEHSVRETPRKTRRERSRHTHIRWPSNLRGNVSTSVMMPLLSDRSGPRPKHDKEMAQPARLLQGELTSRPRMLATLMN